MAPRPLRAARHQQQGAASHAASRVQPDTMIGAPSTWRGSATLVGRVAVTAAAIVCSGAVPVQFVGSPNQVSSDSISRAAPSSRRVPAGPGRRVRRGSLLVLLTSESTMSGGSQPGAASRSSTVSGRIAPTRPAGRPSASSTIRASMTALVMPSQGPSIRTGTRAPGGATIAWWNQGVLPTAASCRSNGKEAASNWPSGASRKVADPGRIEN